MSLPADGVNANALAETTTIPTGKKLIFLDPDTNEGGIITLENLTKQILSNLATQTFNLDQGTKTLLAALNELNSKSPIHSVMHGETDPEGTFKIAIPLDSFWICSFHDKNTNIGGAAIGITSFNSSIAYTGTHNNAIIKIEGNANDGTKFYTNCSIGKYTIAIFKNYSMK